MRAIKIARYNSADKLGWSLIAWLKYEYPTHCKCKQLNIVANLKHFWVSNYQIKNSLYILIDLW